MNYRIDLTEMDNHAGRLNEIGARINTAIGAAVDGVTGLPKDIGPTMAEEFRKEGAKIVDNRGWKSWREMKEEEDEKEKKERGQ